MNLGKYCDRSIKDEGEGRWWNLDRPRVQVRRCKSLLHPFMARHEDCPPNKMVINPYAGCSHRCVYCYATYVWFPDFYDMIQVKINAPQVLEGELSKWKGPIVPIYIAPSTDGYQACEEEFRVTRKCCEVLQAYGVPYYIYSKSSKVLDDLNLHARYKDRCMLVWSIITLDEDVREMLEPFASSSEERLRALERASAEGIRAAVRIDPIIPYLSDELDMLETLVKETAERGATHITVSILKMRGDIWHRLRSLFEAEGRDDLVEAYKHLYFREMVFREGYLYPTRGYRLKLLKAMRKIVTRYGMSFGTCLEGTRYLNTGPCDGVTLKPVRIEKPRQVFS